MIQRPDERMAAINALLFRAPPEASPKSLLESSVFAETNGWMWSARCENRLREAGVETWGDLTKRTEVDLLRQHNLGRITLREIKEGLAYQGLSLLSFL